MIKENEIQKQVKFFETHMNTLVKDIHKLDTYLDQHNNNSTNASKASKRLSMYETILIFLITEKHLHIEPNKKAWSHKNSVWTKKMHTISNHVAPKHVNPINNGMSKSSREEVLKHNHQGPDRE